ncbi:DUF4328 domain-containing protein [Streptomyces sp. For3]|uniref:DUF4328 domain-containing protein n=1 Tax=Streptomyces silvae TaxID=2803812 RepID=UPI001924009B|nr:DUF4328 domain-containing protein [Streptomyces silvae]MBL1291184.1 DUF4328 domain-containing protein [Streptomyces silvae]
MLCTTCGTRPAASADGQCAVCAPVSPAPPYGPMVPGRSFSGLRSPVGLGRATVALLCAVVATDVIALAAGANLRRVYPGPDGGSFYDLATANRAEAFYGVAGGLQTAAMLATVVLFIIWFHRVRLNAEVFDAGLQPMRPGWAIGAWFIPVANFWLPHRIAIGVWTASARPGTDDGRRTVSKVPLDLWWGVWVVSTLFTWVASKYYAYEQEELAPGREAVTLVMAADALDIVAAALAIVFVRKLTRMQGERASLGPAPLSSVSPAGPASV